MRSVARISGLQAGEDVKDIFETAFMPANDVGKFSRFGLVFPQRVITTLQSIGAVTPQGRMILNNLVRDCVVPEMIENAVKANEVTRSPDIWATISQSGWLNPARLSIGDDGIVRPCPDMLIYVGSYLQNSELPAVQEALGLKLMGDWPNPSAAIASAVPQVEAVLMNMARTFEESLRQSVMLDAIPNGITLAGAAADPLAVAVNMASAQANVSSTINYRTMANVAKNFLPSVRNVIEFIVIAAFPLMMLIVIATGHNGGAVLKGYLMTLVWVQLWAPLYAVINYLMVTVDASPLSQLHAAFGGNALVALNLIRDAGATSQDIAGMLTISVPVIAYAMVKTSEVATSSMISTVLAPASGAAQSMGAQLSEGNVSMGRISWGSSDLNNASGNRIDMGWKGASPAMWTYETGDGIATRQGSQLTGVAARPWNVGVAGTVERSRSLANSKGSGIETSSGVEEKASFVAGNRAIYSDGVLASLGRLFTDGQTVTLGGGDSSSTSNGASSTTSANIGDGAQSVASNSQRMGIDGSVGGNAGLSFGGGGDGGGGGKGGGSPIRFGANAGTNYLVQTGQEYMDNAMRQIQGGSVTDASRTAQKVKDAFDRAIALTNDAQVKHALKNAQAHFMKEAASAITWTAANGTKEQARTGEEAKDIGFVGSKVDLSRPIAQRLIEHYGGEMNMLRAANDNPREFNRTAQRIAQEVAQQYEALSQEGLRHVKSHKEVAQLAQNNMDTLHNWGQGQVLGAFGGFRKAVQDQWFANPSTPVNKSEAQERYDSNEQAARKQLSKGEETARVQRGSSAAATALYRLDQMGMGTLLGNAFLGGAGYQSAPQIAEALQRLAVDDPQVKKALIDGSYGGFDPNTASGKQRLELLSDKLRTDRMRELGRQTPTDGPGYNAP
jgi:hypothetical protein